MERIRPLIEQARPYVSRARTWFAGLSRNGKIGVGCGSLIGACVLCSLGSAAIGNGAASTTSPQAQATEQPTDMPAKSWVTIKTFIGPNAQDTPVFHVPDGARIQYDAVTTGNDAFFGLEAQNPDGTDLQLIAGRVGMQDPDEVKGTYTVQGGRDMRLHITGAHINYEVTVQVYQ